jgi:hypothetical protein
MALISQNNNIPMDDINPMDYDALRAFGIDYIQKISGKLWTDFNIHDPGVTILEAVCFALSDLAYRTNFTIEDLLTPKNGINPSIDKPTFLAEEILPCNPTTCDEYRKLILEHIPGVRNVRIEAINPLETSDSDVIKGYYNVYVELEEEEYNHFFDKIHNAFDSDVHSIYKEYFDDNYKKFFQDILRHTLEDNHDSDGELPKHHHRPSRTYKVCYQNAIKKLLTQHRNLCEDFANIVILDTVYLGFKLGLDIKDNADPNDIIDKLYTEIDKYVSPVLQYHTVQDLLDKGMAPEDIFQVYHQADIPTYGLIDIQELHSMPKKSVIYYSDIYNIILSIDGVEGIKEFGFIPTDGIEFLKKGKTIYGIKLCDEKNSVLKLTPFQLSTKRERMKHWVHKSDVQSEITLYTANTLPISAVLIPTASKNTRRFLDEPLDYSLPKITSFNRNIEQFYPVQKLLPQAYAYIPDSSHEKSVLDHAKKHQLKGYLDFFNQLLAEYISRLSSINSYFSIEKDTFPKPYYWDGEKDVSSVTTEYGNVENTEIISPDDERSLNLQNKLLDHLMARFNDTFADYATLLYTSMHDKLPFFEKYYGVKNSIGKKKIMLSEYPSLSGLRSQGVCYNSGKFEISGVERRILARLGICHPNYRLSPKLIKTNKKTGKRTFQNNHLEDYERTFGIHILEHILFAPVKDVNSKTKTGKKPTEDKYSFTVSVVLPGWLDVCLSENFRNYVETIIREEIPAHIKCNIYWVNPLVMWDVENAYVEFLNVMSKQTYPHNHSGWIEQYETVIGKMVKCVKEISDKKSEFSLPNDGEISESNDSWELVSDDNDDENFDRTDSLVL